MNSTLKKLTFFAISIFVAAACCAEDGLSRGSDYRQMNNNGRGNRSRQMNGNRGNRGNRGGRGGGMMMGGFGNFIVEEEMRAKFPKEFAELEKAALELDKKMEALAAKSGVKYTPTMESKLRKLRAADPAGFSAAIGEFKKNPRAGFGKLMELAKKHNVELFQRRGGDRRETPKSSPGRKIGLPNFRKLRQLYPEEMKKYEAMRLENPQKAKEMLEELISRMESQK